MIKKNILSSKKNKFLFFPKKPALILASIFLIYFIMDIVGIFLNWPRGFSLPEGVLEETKKLSSERISGERARLEKRLAAFKPPGVFILIDSGANRLILRRGEDVLRQAVVSCGSGSILDEPGGKRRWIFDTPRGEFAVKSKVVDPDWVKPDWAFIEEGKEPPKNWKERVEPGVLGEYALGFGNGYFIHGTLYTRLLGRNVTHGCIRVGDEDLEAVFRAAQVGTKIYIY